MKIMNRRKWDTSAIEFIQSVCVILNNAIILTSHAVSLQCLFMGFLESILSDTFENSVSLRLECVNQKRILLKHSFPISPLYPLSKTVRGKC